MSTGVAPAKAVDRRHNARTLVLDPCLVSLRVTTVIFTVGDGAHRPFRCILVDLSESGMSVQPFVPLPPNATVDVSLELPGSSLVLPACGMVAWSRPTGRAGIRFDDLAPRSSEILRQWVATYTSGAGLATTPDQPGASALDCALQLVAARAALLTGANGAAIAVGDSSGMVCRASVGNAPGCGVRLQPGVGLSGECLRTSLAVHCADAESDHRIDPALARSLGMRSAVIVPVIAAGQIRAAIEVSSPDAHAFDSARIEQLRRAAALLATVLADSDADRASVAAVVLQATSSTESDDRNSLLRLAALLALMIIVLAGGIYGVRRWRVSVLERGLEAAQADQPAPSAVLENADAPSPPPVSPAPDQPGATPPTRPAKPEAQPKSSAAQSPVLVLRLANRQSELRDRATELSPPPMTAAGLGTTPAITTILRARAASQPKLAANVRVSDLTPGELVTRVNPVYPPTLRNLGIEGDVVLAVTITKLGTVGKVTYVRGPAVLAQAAIAAVKQWRYKPYRLNGEPIDVDMSVTVRFSTH